LAIIFATTRAVRSETFALRRWSGSGISVRCRVITTAALEPENGVSPASMW